MKLRNLILSSACLFGALAPIARAELISNFTSTVTANSPTQFGRPSRNANPQTWAGTESYPGVNPSTVNTLYSYKTYTFAASSFIGAPYVDISFYDVFNSGNLFASAYAGSYNPANRAANWLGDEGFGFNLFGVDAEAFDVILPTGEPLVLVVNTTGLNGAGRGDPFQVAIRAFGDNQFGPPIIPTPEPSSIALLGTGLLGAVGVLRRKLSR